MSRMQAFRIGLCVGIIAAICQTVLAETIQPIQPPDPNGSWLFDGTAAAHGGGHGYDGILEGPTTPTPWSSDVPFPSSLYDKNRSLCTDANDVTVSLPSGFSLGPAGTISMWTKCHDLR